MYATHAKRSYAERHHATRYFNELPLERLPQVNLSVRRAFASDVLFAERIVEENTAKYYIRRGDKWTASRFLSTFDEFDNFILFVNTERAGVLQLRGKGDALWIEGLEVKRSHANKGVSSAAVDYAMTVARRLGYGIIKVQIFSENPVLDVYKQLGFSVVRTDADKILLTRSTALF